MKFTAILAVVAASASAATDMADANVVLAAYDTDKNEYIDGTEIDILMADMLYECGPLACPDGLKTVAEYDGDKDGRFDFWDTWGLCVEVAINKAFCMTCPVE